jgi:hypothetical protein
MPEVAHQRVWLTAEDLPEFWGKIIAERLADTIGAPLPPGMQMLLRELKQAEASPTDRSRSGPTGGRHLMSQPRRD